MVPLTGFRSDFIWNTITRKHWRKCYCLRAFVNWRKFRSRRWLNSLITRSQEHEGLGVKISNSDEKKIWRSCYERSAGKDENIFGEWRKWEWKRFMKKSLKQQLLNIDQYELKFKKDMTVRMHLKNFNKSKIQKSDQKYFTR